MNTRSARFWAEALGLMVEFLSSSEQFRHSLAELFAAHRVPSPEATAAVLAAAVDGVVLHRALGPGLDAATVTAVLHRLLAPVDAGRPHNRKGGKNS
jgi:hypothetical protein